MAKNESTRSATSKAAFSSRRSRGAAKPSVSSLSAEPTRKKRAAFANISAGEARAAKINWTKVDATTEADIARHAREDRSQMPSDREWRTMVREGRVVFVPPAKVNVRAVREKLRLSQAEFAARFGFTAAAVRQWEQGRRQPHGPARVLLTIIDREPGAVSRALRCSAE